MKESIDMKPVSILVSGGGLANFHVWNAVKCGHAMDLPLTSPLRNWGLHSWNYFFYTRNVIGSVVFVNMSF